MYDVIRSNPFALGVRQYLGCQINPMEGVNMYGRERLLTTLGGTRADRVPIAPFLYCNSVYEMFRHKPQIETFWDPPDFDIIEKFVEYCDHFGFDVLHTLGSVWDFGMNTFCDRSVAK